jgi:hypothetical protein
MPLLGQNTANFAISGNQYAVDALALTLLIPPEDYDGLRDATARFLIDDDSRD